VLTAGIDLAAEAGGTAIAIVDWTGPSATLTQLQVGASDAEVLAVMTRGDIDKVALDSPLGWPSAFVDFVVAHRAGRAPAPVGPTGLEWRRSLSRRVTDLYVANGTGVSPLAVGADRIAAVAMRAAGLLAASADAGQPVDRDGSGRVFEAYPAAALRSWKLPYRGYKGAGSLPVRTELIQVMAEQCPFLDWGTWQPQCEDSDDAFDAVVCALIARAAALGLTASPPDEEAQQAAITEGWIHVPTGRLEALLP
jgi:hypothetical protein